jgi:hypothetical protein
MSVYQTVDYVPSYRPVTHSITYEENTPVLSTVLQKRKAKVTYYKPKTRKVKYYEQVPVTTNVRTVRQVPVTTAQPVLEPVVTTHHVVPLPPPTVHVYRTVTPACHNCCHQVGHCYTTRCCH